MEKQKNTECSSEAALEEEVSVIEEVSEAAEETLDPEAVKALQDKCREWEDLYLRARAEAENVRRQSTEEVNKAQRYALGKFATELLSVKDSLELALSAEKQSLETLLTGVQMTLRQLESVFEHIQISVIDPLHQPFNPHFHQAMSMEETDEYAPNTVTRVLQKGYLLSGDRVLRPALVAVSAQKSS